MLIDERLNDAASCTLPRVQLGSYPTRVDALTLATPDGEHDVLVKRDDLCAPGYGGNKIRKLEFLLAEASARGSSRLITAGAAGSHHAFATAYHGAAQGFDVSLVLFPQTRTPHVRRMLQLDHAAGAELRWASRMETVPYGLWRARYAHRAQNPTVIPPGGSSAVGSLGYVNAGLEFASQVAAGEARRPSVIHLAAGTLGTVAGLAVGLAWAGVDMPIIGTRITPRLVTNERVLASLVRSIFEVLAGAGAVDLPSASEALRPVTLRHDQFGDGYGRATPASREATRIFGEAGLQLDDTYTSKAAASLLADLAPGSSGSSSGLAPKSSSASASGENDAPPLFWHTLSAHEPEHLLDHQTRTPMPPPFARYLASD